MSSPPMNLPACLEDARIKTLPASAFYISDFITAEEEEILLNKIQNAPKPKWKVLTHRRLQIWPSDLTKNNSLLDSPLPEWLREPIASRLLDCPMNKSNAKEHIFSNSPHRGPNHVLINEYQPGEGIMPHKDGAAYHPVVCTVSLGSSLCLEIYGTKEDGARESVPKFRILQEPRSLLIITDELYTDYLHGIAEVEQEVDLDQSSIVNFDLLRSPETIKGGKLQRSIRTSLTYRDVIKVSKLGARFSMFKTR